MSCDVMLCHVMPCHIMSFYFISHRIPLANRRAESERYREDEHEPLRKDGALIDKKGVVDSEASLFRRDRSCLKKCASESRSKGTLRGSASSKSSI